MLLRPRHCDDDPVPGTILGTGSAHAVLGPDGPQERHVGGILVPDPEERRGYRVWYVYPEPRPGDGQRSMGFRKP